MAGVLSAFPDGTPVTEIAAALGVTVAEVRWYLGGRTDPYRPGYGTPKPVADLIVSMYVAGASIADIAAASGRSKSTVLGCVKAAGVPRRKRRRRRWDVDGHLVER